MLTEEHLNYMILGGGGLVGRQIAHQIAQDLNPARIVIVSLEPNEVSRVINELRQRFLVNTPKRFILEGEVCDVFVRESFNTPPPEERLSHEARLKDKDARAVLYDDLFGDIDNAYRHSQLAKLILRYRPDVIVDSINTATVISYQDIDSASEEVMECLKRPDAALNDATRGTIERLLVSQSVPQLIRHTIFLHRAMVEAKTRLYLKIGTTGTGGMGLNIPYTHGEDKPSAELMTKTALAFAQTGLMFLMARTQGGPIVKEIKPAAMIGYAEVEYRPVKDKKRRPARLCVSHSELLIDGQNLEVEKENDERCGDLKIVVVNTGENGWFTRGEFETITHLHQMEFVTPEEIASEVVLEIQGYNTGQDVIAAVDGGVMSPTYRAGYLRQFALERLAEKEEESKVPSVAVGQLGPPELTKLLWEAYLIKRNCEGKLSRAVDEGETPDTLARRIWEDLERNPELCQIITSVGVPILKPDGGELVRGPRIKIPEVPEGEVASQETITDETKDKWAKKGWVDLRPQNLEHWKRRFRQMHSSAQQLGQLTGSASHRRDFYLPGDNIEIGAVVAWIFNNEKEADGNLKYGHRIK